MSNYRFPTALKPIVSKGYSYARGSNVFRSEVTGGLPRQGRDTYFEPVPFNVTLVVSALGNQTFQSFLTKISGGADSFVMALDSGLGIKDHQCLITSTVNIDTSDGINWNIAFTLMAERTDIQEETCLTANLPDLFGCYGDGLNCFLDGYATAQTTFPRVWDPNVIAQFSAADQNFIGIGFSRSGAATYIDFSGVLRGAATNAPRYEADGLLLEGESINVLRNSSSVGGVQAGDWFPNNTTYGVLAAVVDPQIGDAVTVTALASGISSRYLWIRPGVQPIVDVGTTVTVSAWVRTPIGSRVNSLRVGCAGLSPTFTSYNVTPGVLTRLSHTATVTSANSIGNMYVWPFINGEASPNCAAGEQLITVGSAQAEIQPRQTSYISTAGAATSRAADVLTLQVQGAKRVYREYTPLGSTTAIAETVPYTGELCPPGHVRVIKVLND